MVVMGLTFERGREISLGKQRLSCERHGLHLFSALRIVRCTLIYILYIFIYFMYIYLKYSCKLEFAVSRTLPKAHLTPSPLSLISTVMFWGISLSFLTQSSHQGHRALHRASVSEQVAFSHLSFE